MKSVYVLGHKMPDTDAVCSAIALSYLKNQMGLKCEPKVIGPINPETEYVLKYFNVAVPSYLNDVKLQISDIKYVKKAYINENAAIEDAFNLMHELDITAIPLVNDKRILTGYVTLKNMAIYLITNSRRYVNTNIDHLLKVLRARIITKFDNEFEGNISSVTFSSDKFMSEVPLDKNSIIIVGDRYKIIEYAINSKVKLIIISGNMTLPEELLKLARKNKVNIITSEYSSFELCNKLSLANYIKTINETPNPTVVELSTYYSDFLSMSRKLNFTNYPILNKKGECTGILRLADVTNYERKKVILVDHNNYEQSVDGLSEAEILEVFDHHNIGNIGTNMPIYFTCRPVGCTCTIVYDRYKKEKVELPKDMAGIMLASIISDTLLFTSPTTTDYDRRFASELADIVGVDIQSFGMQMFEASYSIKGLSVSEVLHQDLKTYNISEEIYGLAQVFIPTNEFDNINGVIDKYVDKLNEMHHTKYKAIILFATDIIRQGSYIIYNTESENLIRDAFKLKDIYEGIFIKGIVSRKKQILPALMKEIER